MTPEQASFLLNTFLPVIKKESRTTSRVLQAVPPDQCQYRPHPDSRSALELAWHIASADIWFLEGFQRGEFIMDDDTMPADFKDTVDVLAWYEDNLGPNLEKAAKLPAEFWATPLSLFEIYNYPPVMYLHLMLLHTVHHRGQLCAYLRQMGAKVPNIYGGSFDEPMSGSGQR